MKKWSIIIIIVFSLNTIGMEVNTTNYVKPQCQFDYDLLLKYISINSLVKNYEEVSLCQANKSNSLFNSSSPSPSPSPSDIMSLIMNFFKIKRDFFSAIEEKKSSNKMLLAENNIAYLNYLFSIYYNVLNYNPIEEIRKSIKAKSVQVKYEKIPHRGDYNFQKRTGDRIIKYKEITKNHSVFDF